MTEIMETGWIVSRFLKMFCTDLIFYIKMDVGDWLQLLCTRTIKIFLQNIENTAKLSNYAMTVRTTFLVIKTLMEKAFLKP